MRLLLSLSLLFLISQDPKPTATFYRFRCLDLPFRRVEPRRVRLGPTASWKQALTMMDGRHSDCAIVSLTEESTNTLLKRQFVEKTL